MSSTITPLPRRLALTTAAAILLPLAAPVAEAQIKDRLNKINPFKDSARISVKLDHPPGLGIDFDRVAFGEPEGQCSGEFVDALQSDFVNNGVEVVERERLDKLLEEHKLSDSGIMDTSTTSEMGGVLGSNAIVLVHVRRCITEQRRQRAGETSYYSYTTAHFAANVEVVALATSKILAARYLDKREEQRNYSSEGYPPYPSKLDVVDMAIGSAVSDIHRMFFPWSELRHLNFYDDNQCNLKLAYRLVQAGDISAALQQSLDNAESCRNMAAGKVKIQARALYNVGMAYCVMYRFEEGLDYLNQSLRLNPSKTTSAAISECRRSRRVDADLQTALADSGQEDPNRPTSAASAAPRAAGRAESSPPQKSVEERLRELKQLLAEGLITQEIYDQKLSEILQDL